MADYYVDQGAYASNLGATPTWGVPQEGDGTATTAAASSAVASVLFNAVPTTGAFTLCGVAVSVTGVLSAASVDAAANALAANVNAATTAVGSGVASGLPQLRNLVFARGPSGGAPAGTCQVMMRAGSDKLNHATNALVAASHTFNGTAPTVTQFVGGTGGCWGWFLANQALGVSSSIAIRTYGLLAAAPMVAYTVPGEFDDIIVRTGRNITVTFTGAFLAQTTRFNPVTFVMDDGTTWTGDSATGKFTVDVSFNGSASFSLFPAGNNYWCAVKCRALGGLTVRASQTSGSAGSNLDIFGLPVGGQSGGQHLEKVIVIEVANSVSATSMASPRLAFQFATSRAEFSMIQCLWDCSAIARVSLPVSFITLNLAASSGGPLTLLGNEFRFNLTGSGGAALARALLQFGTLTDRPYNLVIRGNTCTIGQPGAELPILGMGGAVARPGMTVLAENNTGLGLPAGAVGFGGSGNTTDAVLILDNLNNGGSVKYETRSVYFEFVAGQPVLSAVSPTGTTWSWRAFWTQATAAISAGRRMPCPTTRIQNRLGSGARSWSLEVLLDPVAEANMATGAEVEVEYVTTGNQVVLERVPVVLAASSATWANTAAFTDYVPYVVSGLTASPVLANSIVQIRIAFLRPASVGTAAQFFFDPEPSLT